MKWTKSRVISLVLGVLAAIGAPFIFDLYLFRATSAYSGQQFILHFSSPPTETDFLDAMIRRDPMFGDPEGLIRQWRKTVADGSALKIKIDAQKCLAVKPFDPSDSPDTVFADGARVHGLWVTEPSTRKQFPVPLLVLGYMGASFVSVALATLILLGVIAFIFRLVRTLFDGWQNLWGRSLPGLYVKRRTLEEQKRIKELSKK